MAINIWRRFEEMIKSPAEEVVVITAVNSDGTVTGETLAGGVVRVRCGIDVTAGDQVFVAAGVVNSIAPELDYYELEV